MKKLIVLTVAAVLTAGVVGCNCGNWFRRGALYPVCPPDPACCDPSLPSDPCDPCTTGPQYGPISQIAPGPEAYIPVVPTN